MKTGEDQVGSPAAAWVKDVLLSCAVLPVAAAAGLGLAMSYKMYHPPRKALRQKPEDLGLDAVPLKIPVPGGSTVLDAWYIPATDALGTVIVGHGVGRNKGHALPYAAMLHEAGYNVVAFDHRNHGRSTQDRSLVGMSRRFTDDFEAVICAARSRPELEHGKFALFSFSFSTFPALYVTERVADRVDAIICDSGPAWNISGVYGRFIEYSKLGLPGILRGPLLYRVVESVYRRTADWMLAVRWPPKLDHLSVKLLFITGEEDWLIPPDEVRRIAELHPGSEVWIAPGAGHLMALRTHPERYRELVLGFLERAFQSASSPGVASGGSR